MLLRCHQCSRILRVPDAAVGKKLKCPSCTAVLVIPASTAAGTESEAPGLTPPSLAPESSQSSRREAVPQTVAESPVRKLSSEKVVLSKAGKSGSLTQERPLSPVVLPETPSDVAAKRWLRRFGLSGMALAVLSLAGTYIDRYFDSLSVFNKGTLLLALANVVSAVQAARALSPRNAVRRLLMVATAVGFAGMMLNAGWILRRADLPYWLNTLISFLLLLVPVIIAWKLPRTQPEKSALEIDVPPRLRRVGAAVLVAGVVVFRILGKASRHFDSAVASMLDQIPARWTESLIWDVMGWIYCGIAVVSYWTIYSFGAWYVGAIDSPVTENSTASVLDPNRPNMHSAKFRISPRWVFGSIVATTVTVALSYVYYWNRNTEEDLAWSTQLRQVPPTASQPDVPVPAGYQSEQALEQLQMERAAEMARVEAARVARAGLRSPDMIGGKLREVNQGLLSVVDFTDPDAFLFPKTDSGSAGLSWRVHLLPMIGLSSLYDRFHLNEPWDSPHNSALIPEIPEVFQDAVETGKTCIRSPLRLDGNAAELTRIGSVTDGLWQTVLFCYVGQHAAIPWTRPDTEAPFNLSDEGLLAADSQGITSVVFCADTDPRILKRPDVSVVSALFSPAGNEHFDDWKGLTNLTTAPLRIATIADAGMATPTAPGSGQTETESAEQKLTRISDAIRQRFEAVRTDGNAMFSQSSPLSWRVHLLPYLGETELYRRFQLNEPWDSPGNLPLVQNMPDVYRFESQYGRTRFRLIFAHRPHLAFDGLPMLDSVKDELELTAGVFFAGPQSAQTWTQPEPAAEWNKDRFFHNIGWSPRHSILCGTLGGTTAKLPGNLHSSWWHALQSFEGGESFRISDALEYPLTPIRLAARIQPATPIPELVNLPELSAAEQHSLKAGQFIPPDARLNKIAAAVGNYCAIERRGLGLARTDDGQPSRLSWRVHLLPQLGESELYSRFRRNESWDSEHNRTLLELMPEVYRSFPDQVSTTCYQSFGGTRGLVGSERALSDGNDALNTLMLARVQRSREIPWTQPDPDVPVSELSVSQLADSAEGMSVVFSSQVTAIIPAGFPDDAFRALVTLNGGELLDAATVRRWCGQKMGRHHIPQVMLGQWDQKCLKDVSLAMSSFESMYGVYPPDFTRNDREQPRLANTQLSWRVHVLPILGYSSLYSRFRTEEPWDSPHNLQLLNSMPDCFRDVDDPANSTSTRIMVVSGPGTAWPAPGVAPVQNSITDGLTETLAVISAPKDKAVPWTKPEDYFIADLKSDTDPGLVALTQAPDVMIATFLHSVHRLKPGINTAMLRKLITPDQADNFSDSDVFAE